MKTIDYRGFIDMIYGKCFEADFSQFKIAPCVDVEEIFNEIIDLLRDNVSSMGCQLGLYLPDGVYLPSDEMLAEAKRKNEEIAELKKSLEDAERSYRAALINKGPFEYDDGDYDDDYDDSDDDGDDDDCDYDGDDDDGDYDGDDDDGDYDDGDYDGDDDNNDDDH